MNKTTDIEDLINATKIIEDTSTPTEKCQATTCLIPLLYKDFTDDELNEAIKILSRNFSITTQIEPLKVLFQHLLWERKTRKAESDFFTENSILEEN